MFEKENDLISTNPQSISPEQTPQNQVYSEEVTQGNLREDNKTIQTPAKGNKKTFFKFIIVLFLLFIFLLLVLAIFGSSNNKQSSDLADTNANYFDNEVSVLEEITEEPVEKVFSVVHVDKWNFKPYEGMTNFISKVEDEYSLYGDEYVFEYNNVATLENGDDLIYVTEFSVYENDYNYRTDYLFVVDKEGKVSLLDNYVSSWFFNSFSLREDLSLSSIVVPEIQPKDDIEFGGNIYTSGYLIYEDTYYATGDEMSNLISNSLLFKNEESSFYKGSSSLVNDNNGDKNLLIRSFLLETPDNRVHSYKLEDTEVLRDDRTAMVSWIDPSFDQDTFSTPWAGCDTTFDYYVFTDNVVESDLVKVGVLDVNGESVYRFKEGYILNEIYNFYSSNRNPDFQEVLSLEEFNNANSYFVFKNKIGDYRLFMNSEYQPAAECGKPVIYLYPEEKKLVDVKVGANVTVSDPLYPVDGWKSVLADVDGSLVYEGNDYDYLFWEGTGNGKYPMFIDYGFVVKKDQVVATFNDHLNKLGLNENEIADFIDFWEAYIPNKPYVRLTWLDTEQMNALAPLEIDPKPDTLIRVFLDMQGLERPIDLKGQNLKALKRSGFTVVEWGGLLIK